MNQRTLSIVVGAAVVMGGAIVALRGARHPGADRPLAAVASADASVTTATSGIVVVQTPPTAKAVEIADAAPNNAALSLETLPGTRLPDGSEVPPLPAKAPRSVRFGVVLVAYDGAQGAAPNARTKREALDLARKLAVDAASDFHAAVVRGDSGSIDDAGRMPRGVLEPAPEYVLFTMKPGSVSEPIDTPRGFWVVKRIE